MVAQLVEYTPTKGKDARESLSVVKRTVRATEASSRPYAFREARDRTQQNLKNLDIRFAESSTQSGDYELESILPEASPHVRHLRTLLMAADTSALVALINDHSRCIEPLAKSCMFLESLPGVLGVFITCDKNPGEPPMKVLVRLSEADGLSNWERIRESYFSFVDEFIADFPSEIVILPRFFMK